MENEALVAQFVLIACTSRERAIKCLKKNSWSLEASLQSHFNGEPCDSSESTEVIDLVDETESTPSQSSTVPQGHTSFSSSTFKTEEDQNVSKMISKQNLGKEANVEGQKQQGTHCSKLGASVLNYFFGSEGKGNTIKEERNDGINQMSKPASSVSDVSWCPWSSFGTKKTLSCIVIGETGAGKSTFVNTLTNFYKKGTLDDLKIAIPTKHHKQTERGFVHTELNVQDRSQSSTDNCTTYTFVDATNGKKFDIIDTPGLADTRGAEQDSRNIEKILKAAEDAHSLSAIVLVVNGANPRYTQAIENSSNFVFYKRHYSESFLPQSIQGCMVRLSNCLPDVFKNNILVVFTHCADKIRCIYDKDKLPFSPINDKNMFYMENSFFTASPEEIRKAEEDTRQLFQFEWTRSMKVMQSLVSRVTELDGAATAALGQVRKSRDELASALCDMRLQLRQLQDAQTQLDEVEQAMATASADKSQFAAYTRTKKTREKKMVSVPYHSTICGTCTFVCHERCGLNEIGQKGSHQFTQCAAFSGASNCSFCPGKCSYTDHFHDRKAFVEEEKTLEEVIADIKSKYDSAVNTFDKAASQKDGLAAARQAVEAGIATLVKNVQDACHNIKKHCSNFNLANELAVTIRQLEGERDLLDNLKAIETATKFIDTIKSMVDALSVRSTDSGVYASSKGVRLASSEAAGPGKRAKH